MGARLAPPQLAAAATQAAESTTHGVCPLPGSIPFE